MINGITMTAAVKSHSRVCTRQLPAMRMAGSYLTLPAMLYENHADRSDRRPRWFHLDLDVLTTRAFSAIRYPQPGGLSWPHIETIAHAALKAPGLVGWNITIYNPDLDIGGRGAVRIVTFLETMLNARS